MLMQKNKDTYWFRSSPPIWK